MNMIIQDEVIEGNKLIAEFMLVKIPDRHYLEMNPQLQYYGDSIDEYGTVNNLVSERQLAYHSSWDWLMPVIEKIDSIYFNHYVVTLPIKTDIKTVYEAVISFIKWYNTQKQTV